MQHMVKDAEINFRRSFISRMSHNMGIQEIQTPVPSGFKLTE